MRDVKQYWDDVRELHAGLPEFVWVVDAESSPVQVRAEIAARLLQAKSHRIATEEEVLAFRASQASYSRQQALDRLRREGIAVVAV
jgi:hypothetical protein